MSHRAWAVLAALALVGCGAEDRSSYQPFFPRHGSPFGGSSSAVLEGVAVYDAGCLWIRVDDGTRYLPLWPADAQLGMINSQPAVLGPDGALLAESGDAYTDVVKLGGSEASAQTAEELVGGIPEPCTEGRFWTVADVVGRP